MMQNDLFFSIVISFRDREIQRVKRCFDSFAHQSFKNFEIIFVDYGSELKLLDTLKQLCEHYGIKILQSLNNGMLWNRSHAMNIGLKESKGKYVICTDVDVLLPFDFLENLSKCDLNEFVLYGHRCYYLDKAFEDYDSILKKNYSSLTPPGELGRSMHPIGLFQLFSRSWVESGIAFDERFCIWGYEDLQLLTSFKKNNVIIEFLPESKFQLFHQWHPSSENRLMPGWLKAMRKIFNHEVDIVHPRKVTGQIYRVEDRPVLDVVLGMSKREIGMVEFSEPVHFQLVNYLNQIFTLNKNKVLFFKHRRKIVSKRRRALINFANAALEKLRVNHRLASIDKLLDMEISYFECISIVHYIIVHLDLDRFDYYLKTDSEVEEINFWICLK